MKLPQSEIEVIESEKWGVQIESAVHVYIDTHICPCWLYLLQEYVSPYKCYFSFVKELK